MILDIPPRPKMPIVSREIFNSSRYCVTLTRAGLIVQNHRTGTGKRMEQSHKQYDTWLEAFDSAIDAEESEALARAFLS